MRTVFIDNRLQNVANLSARNDIMKRTEAGPDGLKITVVFQQNQKKGLEGIMQKFSNFLSGTKQAKDSVALTKVFDGLGIGGYEKAFNHIRNKNAVFDLDRISSLSVMIAESKNSNDSFGNMQFLDLQNKL